MPANNSRARREQRKQEALERNAKSNAAMYSCGHTHGIRKGCKGAKRRKTPVSS